MPSRPPTRGPRRTATHGNRRRWRLPVVTSSVVVLATTALLVWNHEWTAYSGQAALSVLVGMSLIAVGARICEVPYGTRAMGLGLMTAGALWPLGWWFVVATTEDGAGGFIGWIFQSALWIPLVYVVSGFPTDARTDRFKGPLLLLAFVLLVPVNLVQSLVSRPSDVGLPDDVWWPTLHEDVEQFDRLSLVYSVGTLLLSFGVLISLVVRLRGAARFDRSIRFPVLAGACTAGLIAGIGSAISGLATSNETYLVTTTTQNAGLLAYPVAFFVAEARLRRKQEQITTAVSSLTSFTVGGVERALGEALSDPSVKIVLWDALRDEVPAVPTADLPGGGGDPSPGPGRSEDAREVSRLAFEGRLVIPIDSVTGDQIAWVTTNVHLRRYPEHLAAAAAAVRLPLEIITQAAVMSTARDDLLASRLRVTRVAQASAREVRERVQHDLHDGAQGRFAALAMRLGLVEMRLGDHPAGVEVTKIRQDLVLAAEGLREFAKGLVPPPMHVFLNAVALDCAPLVVEVSNTVGELQDQDQRADLQFAISEAAANVLKHAGATRLRIGLERDGPIVVVVIADDGRGGATPLGGGLTGITDRAVALGGDLLVDSPPGLGTALTLRFPYAPASTVFPGPAAPRSGAPGARRPLR